MVNNERANPLRTWEFVFLAALAASIVSAAWMASAKSYLTHDEFFTALLCRNPHLGQMVDTVGRGGETNPPLYFILEWGLARIFGTGDFALRALSAIAVALAGWVLYFCARPAVGPRLAALATALVLGLSRDVFVYASMARYYGPFLLAASLAAFLFLKFAAGREIRTRDYVFVFLVHSALLYLHLFGGIYSLMLCLAHVTADLLRRRVRWRLYGCFAAAWASFALWLPFLLKQRQVTKDGTWTPRLPFGLFIEDFALQTPIALVLIMLGLLALLAWCADRPPQAEQELKAGNGAGTAEMILLSLSWTAIPIAIWLVSQVAQPLYMRRYIFPNVAVLVFLLALILGAIYRSRETLVAAGFRLPVWVHNLAFIGLVALGLGFQPLRARMNPPKPAAPYADKDYGHANLPIVFEDTFDYLPRAVYPNGRRYLYLLDKQAEDASSGYYTKVHQRMLEQYLPYYPGIGLCHYTDFSTNPWLMVDHPLGQIFDWITNHHPELKVELLGRWEGEGTNVYWLQRQPSTNPPSPRDAAGK